MKNASRTIAAMVLVASLLFWAGCDSGGDDTYSGPTGTVTGRVRDATTGEGVDGATVSVVGYSQFSGTSSNGGDFEITSPVGDQIIQIILAGYVFPEIPVSVSDGAESAVSEDQTVGSPGLSGGELRIVLTWGEVPSDLDSHLWTPNGQHVYWVDQTPTDAGANLDVDDTDSFGPETTTITTPQEGTYYYYVHNYAGDNYGEVDLPQSNAKVIVYDANGILQTFIVPTSGTGYYWNVMTFELDGETGNLTVVDEIQTTEPIPN